MARQRTAAVVGGSIGGLTAALLLEKAGFSVSVYERSSSELDGRGGGIVLQPEMLRWFKEVSQQDPARLATHSTFLRYLGLGNRIEFEEPVEWRFSSWSTLYRALLQDFGSDRYFLGFNVVDLEQSNASVSLKFDNHSGAIFDLVVFADGITSTGRRLLIPEAQPQYSGYIGWRGTVPENELSDTSMALMGDALGYCFVADGHICMYPIPGPAGETEIGARLMNYVYYQNVAAGGDLTSITTDIDGHVGAYSVPMGRVQQPYIDRMKIHAARTLAPAAAELVTSTQQPYIQVIFDVRVPRMAVGRVAVIGDAAFVARPHAAAGSAKVADDAWALHHAFLASDADVPDILEAWEADRLDVGNRLIERVSLMGRRAQFDHSWDPADLDLRFGLKEGVRQPNY